MAGTDRSGEARRVLLIMGEVFVDGGIQRFNKTFIAALDRLGVRADVLTLNDDESRRSRWAAPGSANIRVFGRRKVRFALATYLRLLSGRYDRVFIGHINLLTLVIAALVRPRRGSSRAVLIAHGIEVWTSITGRRRRALRSVDTVLCVSRYTAATIRQQAPEIPARRFTIFPNALSESWLEKFANVGSITRLRQLPERYFLSVTRVDKGDRYKGITTVLETLAMLDDTTLHYVIAGHGNDLPFLKGVAERHGVTDRVHFLGAVSDGELADLYRNCLAFVLPSGKEGFGIVFLEAMYFGAPVIGAAEKGALDVIEHERTGLLVPYGDCVALKGAMERVVGETSLASSLRVEASRGVTGQGQFTFNAYVRRLGDLLGLTVATVTDGRHVHDHGQFRMVESPQEARAHQSGTK